MGIIDGLLVNLIMGGAHKAHLKATGQTENDWRNNNIKQRADVLKNKDGMTREECFVVLIGEQLVYSASDLLCAWEQFGGLVTKYPKADELIRRQAESEKEAGKVDELKIDRTKRILKSMLPHDEEFDWK